MRSDDVNREKDQAQIDPSEAKALDRLLKAVKAVQPDDDEDRCPDCGGRVCEPVEGCYEPDVDCVYPDGMACEDCGYVRDSYDINDWNTSKGEIDRIGGEE